MEKYILFCASTHIYTKQLLLLICRFKAALIPRVLVVRCLMYLCEGAPYCYKWPKAALTVSQQQPYWSVTPVLTGCTFCLWCQPCWRRRTSTCTCGPSGGWSAAWRRRLSPRWSPCWPRSSTRCAWCGAARSTTAARSAWCCCCRSSATCSSRRWGASAPSRPTLHGGGSGNVLLHTEAESSSLALGQNVKNLLKFPFILF